MMHQFRNFQVYYGGVKTICILQNYEFWYGSLSGLHFLRKCWTVVLSRSSQLAGHEATMLQVCWAIKLWW